MHTKRIRISKQTYDAMSFQELWEVCASLAVDKRASMWAGRPYIQVSARYRDVHLFEFQCDSLEKAVSITDDKIEKLSAHTKLIDDFLCAESVDHIPSLSEHFSSDAEFERLAAITGRPIGELIREYMKDFQPNGLSEYDLTDEQKIRIGKKNWNKHPEPPVFDIAKIMDEKGDMIFENVQVLQFDNDFVSFKQEVPKVPFLFEVTHFNPKSTFKPNVLYEAFSIHTEDRFLKVHFWKYRKVETLVAPEINP